jgi:hypothetical protein
MRVNWCGFLREETRGLSPGFPRFPVTGLRDGCGRNGLCAFLCAEGPGSRDGRNGRVLSGVVRRGFHRARQRPGRGTLGWRRLLGTGRILSGFRPIANGLRSDEGVCLVMALLRCGSTGAVSFARKHADVPRFPPRTLRQVRQFRGPRTVLTRSKQKARLCRILEAKPHLHDNGRLTNCQGLTSG